MKDREEEEEVFASLPLSAAETVRVSESYAAMLRHRSSLAAEKCSRHPYGFVHDTANSSVLSCSNASTQQWVSPAGARC